MPWSSNRGLVAQLQQHPIINSLDIVHGVDGLPSAAAWPVTSLAIYIPFTVVASYTAKRMFYQVGVSSGNMDLGIYDLDGTKKVTLGSTAVGSGSTIIVADITDTTLDPGSYYMAVAFDNTTVTVSRFPIGGSWRNAAYGIKEETSAFPLPATATPVDNLTRLYLPLISIGSET